MDQLKTLAWMLARTKKTDSCWLWYGTMTAEGYGAVELKDICTKAHRHMYELVHGPIPGGMLVLHKCDIRRCVNLEHLFLGTHQDNANDRVKKGRNGKQSYCRAKLSDEQVRAIRNDSRPAKVVAKDYKVTNVTIYNLWYGITYKHVV